MSKNLPSEVPGRKRVYVNGNELHDVNVTIERCNTGKGALVELRIHGAHVSISDAGIHISTFGEPNAENQDASDERYQTLSAKSADQRENG